MEKEKKLKSCKVVIRNILVVALILMAIVMFQKINSLQGTARIINYAGVLRGATQRLVKLEINGQKNDELLNRIDEVFYGLKHGSEKYNLIKIEYNDFQESLKMWENNWIKLKNQIQKTRKDEIDKSNIVELSEENFEIADVTVNEIEVYTQHLVDQMHIIEFLIILDGLGFIYLLINESMKRKQLSKINSELAKKASLDLHTGLMNKGKCNELFNNQKVILEDLAVIMFDLNNLKKVNDMYGHIRGDKFISDFSNILKKTISKGNFIGRYGGDEFVVVLYNSNEYQVKKLIESLEDSIRYFNEITEKPNLSFAYGYDGSWNYEECNMKMLLDNADSNMYLNKQNIKLKDNEI